MADKNKKTDALYEWLSADLEGLRDELMTELQLSAAQIVSMYESIKGNNADTANAITQEIRYSYKQNQNIYDGIASLVTTDVTKKIEEVGEKVENLQKLENLLTEISDLKYSYMQMQTIYDGLSAVLSDEVAPKVDAILDKTVVLDSITATLQEISEKIDNSGLSKEDIEKVIEDNVTPTLDSMDAALQEITAKLADCVSLTEEDTKRIVDESVSVHSQQVLDAVAAIPVAENIDYIRICEDVSEKVIEALDAKAAVAEESEAVAPEVDYDRINEMITQAVTAAIDVDAIATAVAAKIAIPEVEAPAMDIDAIADAVAAKITIPEVEVPAMDIDAVALAVAAKIAIPEVEAPSVDVDAVATAVVDKIEIPEAKAAEVDYDTLAAIVATKIVIPEVNVPEVDYDKLADLVLDKLAAKGISADVILDDEGIEKIAETVAGKVGTVENIDYDKVCLAAQAAQILPDPVDYDRVAEIVEDKLSKGYEEIERVVTLDEEGIEKIVNGVADELRNMTLVCECECQTATVEEAAEEEPVVEETQEVVEVVEETQPVEEEAPVEEVVEETVATEEIAVTNAEPVYEELNGELIDAETGLVLRLKRSFTAKMKQSDEKVKSYYSDIKNELTSYKKINSNVSWHGDRFNLGRDTIAKIGINGKTLCFYIALDPNDPELKSTVYHQKDVGEQKAYESTPFMVKIKSDAALKKALRLVAIFAEKRGVEKDPKFVPVDYVTEFAYETTMALVDGGYIKATKEKKVDFNF